MTKPNFLIIMSDEHAPMYSSVYGHRIVQTPNMERLAAAGATFDAAYCNSPLCMPSRMSFMTGRLINKIGAWDNVTPLRSDQVTWTHRLRAQGYDLALSGKQHFGGADQLHGFQKQLARDLHAENYHAIHLWDEGIVPAEQPWPEVFHSGTGAYRRNRNAMTWRGIKPWNTCAIRRGATDPGRSMVSFIAAAFPADCGRSVSGTCDPVAEMDLPVIPDGDLDNLHPVPQGLRMMFGFPRFPDAIVRQARAGYYALISYLDEKIGELVDTLQATGQYENTVIILHQRPWRHERRAWHVAKIQLL